MSYVTDMKVSVRLDEILGEKKMTLRGLSLKTGLSTQALSSIKNRKSVRIELETIGLLCKVLKCSPNDLFKLKTNG